MELKSLLIVNVKVICLSKGSVPSCISRVGVSPVSLKPKQVLTGLEPKPYKNIYFILDQGVSSSL